MDSFDELIDFLKVSTRLDIKSLALHHILSMTGDLQSRNMIISHKNAVNFIIILAFKKDEQKSINKDAFFTLINLSADDLVSKRMLEKNPALIRLLIDYIIDEQSPFADTACAVLSNLSRLKDNCDLIYEQYFAQSKVNDSNNNEEEKQRLELKAKENFSKLLAVFCTENYNKKNKLDYLAPFICNLTQVEAVRDLIVNDNSTFNRLLPFISYQRSIIRRGGIIGSIKNLFFSYDKHEQLLFSSELDLLSRLLLPLAGPEELDDDDMEKLPEDLQYLPQDKEREDDPDIRIMLIETLMLLCSHKKCRQYIKDKNAYVILRELHKWEKDERVKLVLEKLVQILIADEPETDMENFHQISVPDHLSQKFYEFEQTELEKNFE